MIISIQPGSTIDSKNPQSLSSTSPNTESESNSRKINAKRIMQAYPGIGKSNGENISAFIEQCDPVAGMVKDGLLTPEKGNDYRWHQSENARSCDILDGVIHIFSHTMSAASPAAELEPVGITSFLPLPALRIRHDSRCR